MRHWNYLTDVMEENRHYNEERRHAYQRALEENRVIRPSLSIRLKSKINSLRKEDHTLTNYPCKLPNGKMGRVAVIAQDGDWAFVCKVA